MADLEFIGEKPERLNIEALKAAVAAVAPGVSVEFKDSITWEQYPGRSAIPYDHETPANTKEPYLQLAILRFKNVPDGVTKEQVRNFIRNHSPAKTDDEERRERVGAQIVQSVLRASDEELQALKTRLATLGR